MLLAARGIFLAARRKPRLPYDSEVEYLQSSGTQWIDIDASKVATASRYVCAGKYMVNSNQAMMWSHGYRGIRSYGAYISFVTGKYATTNTTVRYDTECIIEFDAASLKGILTSLGGTELANVTIGSSSASGGLRIFAASETATGYLASQSRLYFMRVYDAEGNILLDLIPVRRGTVGYLYDRVSGKLFGNAGTGDFVLGQDVVPVEYIESHGTEWIDTGVASGPSNLEFTIDCTITNTIGTSEPYWTGSGVNSIGGLHYVLEQLGIRTGGGTITNSIPYTSGERVQIRTYYDEQNRRSVQIGDRYYYGSAYSAPTGNLCLLRMVKFANQRGLFFGATVSQGGDFVRKFRPVRVGTEGAMMDVLTRRIYRNAGTGAFTYGNDLKYPIPAE